ncbi:futalosine hydrolase [Fontibacillus phaseoli]|uniref:Futalosine hydrolase n=1 Tax=Fontibacillus phaseoli TaxID=1416533 RepID=A0A369B8X5_9BACL|nr:futalosine hydrolase [Fontibacillus phaseoli]RCX16987.1 futalosine hydrolase [Fontibacillus phaseoli]
MTNQNNPQEQNPRSAYKRVLIMTAVDAEREAVLRGLGRAASTAGADIAPVVDVRLAGVGPARAAASTASELASGAYDLVVSAGIGGGFEGCAPIGSLVVASEIIAADLGAETPDGFASVDELGFGSAAVAVAGSLATGWTAALQAAGLPACYGPVLTLSTVTGTAATAKLLAERIRGAAAEAMEGFGVAAAAHRLGIPVLEIRAISNRIGPRQRELWKIGEALQALEEACSILPEVLQT